MMRHQQPQQPTSPEPYYTSTPAPQSISLTSPAGTPPKGRFYFAYGSNLSPTQMLARCPSSAQPIAIAKLTSYTWFICDRGYANVIAVPPWEPTRDTEASTVFGLIYWLTTMDEEALDGFEGWDLRKCAGENPVERERTWKPYLQGDCDYNKFYLKVGVERWIVPLHCPTAQSLSGNVGNDGGGTVSSVLFDTASPDIELGGDVVTVLVYVDEVRTLPGRIKDEYVTRLSRAALESIPYGIPEGWFDMNMKRHGVEWWKGRRTKYDKKNSLRFMTAPSRGEWEDLRARLLLEDVQRKEKDRGMN